MTTVDLSWKLRAQKAEVAYAKAAEELFMQARQHEGDGYIISDLRAELGKAEAENKRYVEALEAILHVCDQISDAQRNNTPGVDISGVGVMRNFAASIHGALHSSTSNQT